MSLYRQDRPAPRVLNARKSRPLVVCLGLIVGIPSSPGFLNPGTVGVWCWVILGCEALSCVLDVDV